MTSTPVDRPATVPPYPHAPSADALIDHILQRYHDAHRAQLPHLIELARRVERVHADRSDCPHGLAAHLAEMRAVLETHMHKDERVLFPMLRHRPPGTVQAPILVMRAEHDDHDRALTRLSALCGGYVAPEHACGSWRALYDGASQLHQDLQQHIRLENELLFSGALTAGGTPNAGDTPNAPPGTCGCACKPA